MRRLLVKITMTQESHEKCKQCQIVYTNSAHTAQHFTIAEWYDDVHTQIQVSSYLDLQFKGVRHWSLHCEL